MHGDVDARHIGACVSTRYAFFFEGPLRESPKLRRFGRIVRRLLRLLPERPLCVSDRLRRDGLRDFDFVFFFAAVGLLDLLRGLCGPVDAVSLGWLASATKDANRLSVSWPSYKCFPQKAKMLACTVFANE